jgi:hypothetical protein
MSVWAWLAIGIGAFFGVALALGLAIARILGRISHDVTDLLEAEAWSAAPLTRALEAPPEVPTTAPAGGRESLRSSD